jgi:hypothetical protein
MPLQEEGYIWEYEEGEPIVGSCDGCGGDVYASECEFDGLCDQCRWWSDQSEDGYEELED